jgi:hypothetical protein
MALRLGGRALEAQGDDGPAAPEVLDHVLHPELELRPGRGARQRREAVTQIVLHWTAGEPRDVETFRAVLHRRRVGCHFFVDRQGSVWQLCDPLEVEAFHAGGLVNRRSIGIEVAGYGFRWPARTRWNLLEVPRRGRDREIYETQISGRRYFLADYYSVQTQAVALLVETLVQELPDVDRAVPLEPDGSLRTRRFTRKEARAYSGVLGHLHVPGSTKLDPGTRPLEVLRLRFQGDAHGHLPPR